jgi:hypothetical protein
MRLRKSARCAAVLGATAVLAVGAGVAQAGTEHYCQGRTITPGYACSNGNVHTGTTYVEAIVNHTACVGFGQHGGVYYAPYQEIFFAFACSSGSGTIGGYRNGGSGHAGVVNRNQITNVYIYDAHQTW